MGSSTDEEAPPSPVADEDAAAQPPTDDSDGAENDYDAPVGAPDTQNIQDRASQNALPSALTPSRRRLDQLFANDPPGYSPQSLSRSKSGIIVGNVGATDPDLDQLRYRVASRPGHGSVAITSNGTFVYFPRWNRRDDGLSDTFTVSVSDSTRIFGFIRLPRHFVNVPVTVVRGNTAPRPTPQPQAGYDSTTGTASGTVAATDIDDDTITYRLAAPIDPAVGVAVVDPTSGQWTFTPNPAARATARRTGTTADDVVPIVIEADDGDAGPTSPIQLVHAFAPMVRDYTYAVSATFETPAQPQRVVISPDGEYAYVSAGSPLGGEPLSGTVVKISLATGTVVGTTQVGAAPQGLALSPDGREIYVATSDGINDRSISDQKLYTVDSTTMTVTRTATYGLPNVNSPNAAGQSVVVSNDGRVVFTQYHLGGGTGRAAGPSGVVAMDASTGEVLWRNTIRGLGGPLGPLLPTNIALTRDQRRLYATGFNGVVVMDMATGSTLAVIDMTYREPGVAYNVRPTGIVLTLDARRGFAVNSSSDTNAFSSIIPLDIVSNRAANRPGEVIAAGPGRSQPPDPMEAIVLSPDGARAYLIRDGDLVVLDTQTGTLTSTPVGVSLPTGAQLAISLDGTTLLVVDTQRQTTGPDSRSTLWAITIAPQAQPVI